MNCFIVKVIYSILFITANIYLNHFNTLAIFEYLFVIFFSVF